MLDANYPVSFRPAIRSWEPAARRAVRPLAWLACAALAACEVSAPVPSIEPADAAPSTAFIEDRTAAAGDLSELLVSESCERDGDRLCAVEAIARLVEAPSITEPAAGTETGPAGAGEPSARGARGDDPRTNGSRPVSSSRQALNDRLWRLTGEFPPAEVAELSQHHELAPLWRLRQAMSGSRSAHEQAERLRAWMAGQPGHPFVLTPPESLARVLNPAPFAAPAGLFVPLTGALAAAGRAVRDGFIAAWLDDTAPLKPPLRIYDTAGGPIGAIYERSLADGVGLIVGPLSKQRLEALRRLNPRVAVLGLNYLETAGGGAPGERERARLAGSFLQVGLAIEDEAATIGERLLRGDLQRLLAVHGGDDWAVRGVRALTEAWPYSIEGLAIGDVRTITESVGTATGVVASEERKADLERLLNRDLEFMPRPRSDLDGVVAFVDHLEAAALAPALNYHLAGRPPPVYASSQSVRNATRLSELGAFQVTVMPFDLRAAPLWDAVKTEFGDGGGNIAALRALGMDAWRIVSHWNWVAGGEPLYGATGKLRLDGNGQVRRRLAWASISRGSLRPMAASFQADR